MSSALALSSIAPRGRSRVAVVLVALALPLFAVPVWSRAYADALGNGIAAFLVAAVPTLPPASAEEAWSGDLDAWSGVLDDRASFASSPSARGAALDAKRPHQASHARVAKPLHGIRVSSSQVLALAARRAMPNAVFVKANAERPAGLLLSGVSTLGIGLQDGDVLTEAAGQRASSVAVVVGVVLAARARQVSEISGRFYRGGVPFSLTVEQPYPKAPVPG